MDQLYKLLGLANLAVNKVERRLQRNSLYSMPVDIDLVLTRACNLYCIFCRDYETKGKKYASDQDIASIARQLFPTARDLYICSGGEPYLHRGLEQVLRLGKYYGLRTTLSTNGMLFQDQRIRAILQERLLTVHSFSVDGNEAGTVAKLRVHADLEQIVDNMGRFVQMRDDISPGTPLVRVGYVLMRSTIEELPSAIERWGKMRVDLLWCHYLGVANDVNPNESLFFHQDLMKTVFKEARDVAARYPRLTLYLPPTVEDEIPKQTNPLRCQHPRAFVMIDSDGTVLPCYEAYEALQVGCVYSKDAPSFRSIWNNASYQELRRTVNEPGAKFFNYCSRCEHRFGYGDLGAHLVDKSWTEALREQKGDSAHIDHGRACHTSSRRQIDPRRRAKAEHGL